MGDVYFNSSVLYYTIRWVMYILIMMGNVFSRGKMAFDVRSSRGFLGVEDVTKEKKPLGVKT